MQNIGKPQTSAAGQSHPTTLDLSARELGRYSIMRAISAMAEGTLAEAGFEMECHSAIAKRLGRAPTSANGFFVPFDVQQKRDLTAASGAAGGYLVATENVGFNEILRNRSIAFAMGVTRLSGLVGNVTIPRQTGASTANWLTDEAGTGGAESNLIIGQMSMTPKTVVAYTEISRQLQLQASPAAEGLVMTDVAAQVALAVDAATLTGTGSSGQPLGIVNTAGIGSFSGTTLGLAAIVEAQTDAAAANALSASSGYVTTPTVAGLLAQRQRFASTDTPIWEGPLLEGKVAGFRAMATNQMPASRVLFGDFSTVVLGEWGVLEIAVNKVANFVAGIIGIRAMYSVDVGVRYPGAFSYSTAVT